MKIIHVSDIHIRPLSRHNEYKKGLELFFKQAREIQPDLIVNTGDLVHSKTLVTSELFSMLSWFFKECTAIAPMINILGNHDGALTNNQRTDVVSSVIEAINIPNCFLYKKSGIYYHTFNNQKIAFTVFSLFDKKPWINLKPDTSKDIDVNIALFHGAVVDSKTDLNWKITHGEEYIKESKTRQVSIDFFDGYDFVMLGDIHKQQFLKYRPKGREQIVTEEELLKLQKMDNIQIEIIEEMEDEEI